MKGYTTLAVIVLVVLATLAFVFKKKRRPISLGEEPWQFLREEPWPFYAKKPLTQPEQVLYHRLVKALPECIVLAQVQLSRILGVKKGFSYRRWFNRINRMSVDFLVCLKDSTVVAAIELDDSSHNDPARQEADAKKDRALRSADITIFRWSVASLPNEAAIRAAIAADPAPTASDAVPVAADPVPSRFHLSAETSRQEPHL